MLMFPLGIFCFEPLTLITGPAESTFVVLVQWVSAWTGLVFVQIVGTDCECRYSVTHVFTMNVAMRQI